MKVHCVSDIAAKKGYLGLKPMSAIRHHCLAVLFLLIALTPLSLWAANQSPQARAGNDQTVEPGAAVTLDGSASTDPDGGTLTYSWQEAGEVDCGLEPSATDQSTVTFTAPSEETECVLKLYVKDGQGGLDSDEVTVFVRIPETPEASTPTVTEVETGEEMTGGKGCSLNRQNGASANPMILLIFLAFIGIILRQRNSHGCFADNKRERKRVI